MKKKVWNVSVLDNPNRAVMGENDEFYTTDTEAFLVFELADANFKPKNALLTLINRNDKSVVSEVVNVVDGVIKYELREEVIAHYGNWQAQLVYRQPKDGITESYTSQPIQFVVEGHIASGQLPPPPLEIIESWELFMLHAQDFLDGYDGRLTNVENNKADQSDVDEVTTQLAHKGVELNTLESLINYDSAIGDFVSTKGYYAIGDGGGGQYVIKSDSNLNEGVADDGILIALNNGLVAELVHSGTIYARQYGVKLDDVTDDTDRLNALLKNFSKAKIVINDGMARTTDTLLVKGRWRANNERIRDNSIQQLVFENANIRYDGPEDGCSVFFWNVFHGMIEGLSIARISTSNYVDMAKMWHTEFRNFDVMGLRINYDITTAGETIDALSTHTMHFNNGFISDGNLKMYNLTYLNTIHFTETNFYNRDSDYSVEFYGEGAFQNITFTKCDMSYAKKELFYFHDRATRPMNSITLESCYLDSSVQYAENNDFKGFNIHVFNTMESAITSVPKQMVTTYDFLNSTRMRTFGAIANNIPTSPMNLVLNGDFSYPKIVRVNEKLWVRGEASLPENSHMSKNPSSPSGNSLVTNFGNEQMSVLFYGINFPVSAKYTASVRCIKRSGEGRLQITTGGEHTWYDLSEIEVGEEFIMIGNGWGMNIPEKDEQPRITIQNISGNAMSIEFLEVSVTMGTYYEMNTRLAPGADLSKEALTKDMPDADKVEIGESIFNSTLGKPLWSTGTTWVDSEGAVVQ